MKKLFGAVSGASLALMVTAMPVFAETITLTPKSDTFKGLTDITIPGIISGLIGLVLVIAAVIFFFMLVIGGIRWMLSGGDKAGTEGARGQITAALVGLAIVFSAWAIIQLVKTLFGVDILGGLTIPSFK